MRGILILIPAALLLGGIFLALFIAAARRGQFDDLDDPPKRMLQD
ncbi:MAG TPA: cbb3-type cytochrome oxidase assembly protein CcoS [Longimicrobiales bacterium]